jgi:ribosome-binding protein aMBF1 (putative translation factor)
MLVLTQLRTARGWSRAELARRAGMSAGDVGKIEAGWLVPYPSQRRKLAAALEVPGRAEHLLEKVDTRRLRDHRHE